MLKKALLALLTLALLTAAIDADTATVGVPLTFHYSVTGGSGSYQSVDVYMDQQNKAYDRAGDG